MKITKNIITVLLSIIMIFSCIFNVSALKTENKLYLSAPKSVNLNQNFELTITATGENIYGVSSIISFDSNLVKFESMVCDFPDSWKVETNVIENRIVFASTDQMLKSPINNKIDLIKIKFTALDTSSNCEFMTSESYFTDSSQNIIVDNSSVSLIILKSEDSDNQSGDDQSSNDGQDENDLPSGDVDDQSSNKDDQDSNEPSENEQLDDKYPSNNEQMENDQQSDSNDSQSDSDEENEEQIIEIFESNYLKSLIVKNAEISPAFDPEVKDYTANVPYETKELQVEAEPLDENATVNISETELKFIGKNITRIQVISSSGKKRTYKIYTTRNKNTNTNGIGVDNGYMWLWILIGSVAVLGIAATVVVILVVKKRKMRKQ